MHKSFYRVMVVVALAGAPIFAQSLAESAAAASGGSAAGAAGKTVSDGFAKVFGAASVPLDRATRTGGSTTIARPVPKVPATPRRTGEPAGHAPAAPAAKVLPHPRIVRIPAVTSSGTHAEEPSGAPLQIPPMASHSIPPPIPTAADLENIKPGFTRQAVVAKLGSPTDRIQIPEDDGHLTEVMHYALHGSELGTVHMSDGVVTEVQATN